MPQHSPDLSTSRIAIVEDDEDIRANVCRFLEKSGLQAWGVPSAEDFYVRLLRDRADLVVVDLGLPGEGGLSLVRRLSAQRIPVIVLTARGELESRIAGLDAGALQYFVKPADMGELVAGIRAQLRQHARMAGAGALPAGAVAVWRLDSTTARLVAPNQQALLLTSRELALMGCLVEAQGALVTKQALVDALGYEGSVDDTFHRVETMLSRMRRKSQESTGQPLPVRAVFGRGLAFVP